MHGLALSEAALSGTCFTTIYDFYAGAGRKPLELSNDEKLCAHQPEGTLVAASCASSKICGVEATEKSVTDNKLLEVSVTIN